VIDGDSTGDLVRELMHLVSVQFYRDFFSLFMFLFLFYPFVLFIFVYNLCHVVASWCIFVSIILVVRNNLCH